MAEGPVLTSRSWERRARLAFADFRPGDAYVNEFTVIVDAEGLAASAPVISDPDGYGLPRFFQSLADDFRGWDGIRFWRSLEDQLRIEATWHAGGHVSLLFHVTPSVYDKWTLSVEFTLEAGQELQTLSDALATFTTEQH